MTNSPEPQSEQIVSGTVRLNWSWRCEDANGVEVASETGSGRGFPTQSDAESWVGEVWRDLLDEGVEQVTLFEGDRLVYGPMSLSS